MPSPEQLDEFEQDQTDQHILLVAALVAYASSDPAPDAEALREFVRTLVLEYTQASAVSAAEFYGSWRPADAPAFSALPMVSDDLLGDGTLKWATEPLETDDMGAALDRLVRSVRKATYGAAVNTIGQATEDDPIDARYARWPKNPDPCAYCVLRASRGAVYWSEASAERGDHLKCGCKVTPVFPGESLPYQRKPYMAQYVAGSQQGEGEIAAAGPGKAKRKALLSAMRRANGTR